MSFPQLFTSRWSNKALADLACVPVGISRGVPKFPLPYRYRLLRELAPSRETFALEDEREFRRAYRRQLDALGLDVILGKLEAVSERDGGLPLVLLCFEPADQFCHRHIIRDWLRWENVPIREFTPGDLPKHPNTITPTLF